MNAAQFLRSAHQSWGSRGAFKGVRILRIYRVSGLFRGSMQPGRRPDRPAAESCSNMTCRELTAPNVLGKPAR
jgi:hypothetical protein